MKVSTRKYYMGERLWVFIFSKSFLLDFDNLLNSNWIFERWYVSGALIDQQGWLRDDYWCLDRTCSKWHTRWKLIEPSNPFNLTGLLTAIKLINFVLKDYLKLIVPSSLQGNSQKKFILTGEKLLRVVCL